MKQTEAVLAAIKSDPTLKETPVSAALCFIDSEWALLDFPFQVGYVWVMYPGALRKQLKKGALSASNGLSRAHVISNTPNLNQ